MPHIERNPFNGFSRGDKVICNGYPGTVTELCRWSNSMVEVRLSSGVVCVDSYSLELPTEKES